MTPSPALSAFLRDAGVREPLPVAPQPERVIPARHPEIAAWIKNPVGEVPW